MREIRVLSTEEMIKAFNVLGNHYIFRGQSDANWPLSSSLERIIGTRWSSTEVTKFEDYSLDTFKSKFHLYDRDNLEPKSKLAWLGIMQHYGVPTRLVDFTVSPYVALYFALETYQPTTKADIVVYALDYTAIMEESIKHLSAKDTTFKETRQSVTSKEDRIFDETVDRFSYDIVWVTQPGVHNTRLDLQGGCFVVSGNREVRIADALSLGLYGGCDFTRFRIDGSLYTGIFALLRKMNVTSKSLYGDLDGLARSIRMQMQVYSVPVS
jgi:hypothetical protein